MISNKHCRVLKVQIFLNNLLYKSNNSIPTQRITSIRQTIKLHIFKEKELNQSNKNYIIETKFHETQKGKINLKKERGTYRDIRASGNDGDRVWFGVVKSSNAEVWSQTKASLRRGDVGVDQIHHLPVFSQHVLNVS